MPLPRWLARLNRRVTNPVLRPLAARLPFFGVVVHRGRTSGRLYRTPVNAFRNGEDFIVALTYGPDVDWVKNVLDGAGCQLIHRGRAIELARPRIIPIRQAAGSIPIWIRGILRIFRVREALYLKARSAPTA